MPDNAHGTLTFELFPDSFNPDISLCKPLCLLKHITRGEKKTKNLQGRNSIVNFGICHLLESPSPILQCQGATQEVLQPGDTNENIQYMISTTTDPQLQKLQKTGEQ